MKRLVKSAAARALQWFLRVCLFLFVAILAAQELRIKEVEVNSTGEVTIQVEAPAGGSVVLLQGSTVTNITSPVTTNAVQAGTTRFIHAPVPNQATHFYRIQQLAAAPAPLTTISETSPADGESGVSVTRETVVRFSAPLSANAVLGPNHFYATVGARRLLSRVELSPDRRTATLFYLEPLPGNTRIYANFDATGLTDILNNPIDPDGDGAGGGIAQFAFETASTATIDGTVIIGRVFAAELIPGPTNTTTSINRPLEGVTITLDGKEESIRSTTDAMGNFKLTPVPAGRFFVHIDGRTAKESNYPNGAYYPLLGKAWTAIAGREDNLAAGTGTIYLPLIAPNTLQPVSATEETVITLPSAVLANNPALAGTTIIVPPNSLFGENGTRGGRIGIAPVPSDRLPEPLPPGLNHAIDISIQTDGGSNFSVPVPVRFPNLPDPITGKKLPPGAKAALWSFDHDLGRWEIQGSMTVSVDGNFVETDPGVGIRQPGWHWWNQGVQGCCGPITGGPPPGSNCQTNCLANTSLSGGAASASHVNICAGGSIIFESTGVTVHPGTLRTVCTDQNRNVVSDIISPTSGGPVEYKWEITRDGASFSTGNGATAVVTPAQPGDYVCTFTVKVEDECPSSAKTLTSPVATVTNSGPNPNDIDCDGLANGNDPDVDGDGKLNGQDPDVDGDGLLNGEDPDIDGDGIPNEQDDNMDGDENPNESDPDKDGDDIPDDVDCNIPGVFAESSPNSSCELPHLEVIVAGAPTFTIIRGPPPTMPLVRAIARIKGIEPDPTPTTEFAWTYSYYLPAGITQGGRVVGDSTTFYPDPKTPKDGSVHEMSFDGIVGGFIMLRVQCNVADNNGVSRTLVGQRMITVLGSNPDISAISQTIADEASRIGLSSDDTVRRIICYENRQSETTPLTPFQFDANGYPRWNRTANGGAGDGGVGIAQITADRLPIHVWSWEANVREAVRRWKTWYLAGARGAWPTQLKNKVLEHYNSTWTPTLADVTVPPLSEDDLRLEAIRRYNGVFGKDPIAPGYGLLHEWRFKRVLVPVNGQPIPKLAVSADGKVEWERVPEADRPTNAGDPNYVNGVLNFPSCGL